MNTCLTVGDYILTFNLWLAALLQAAAIRDRTIADSPLVESYRFVFLAGLAGLAMRFTYVLFDDGVLQVPFHSLIALLFISIGILGLTGTRVLTKPRSPNCENRRNTDLMPLSDR